MNPDYKDVIDEMVRDFTQVSPRTKSEVRSRIEELTAKAEKAGRKKAVEYIEKHGFIWHHLSGDDWDDYKKVLQSATNQEEHG